MDCLCQSLEHICIEQEKCPKCLWERMLVLRYFDSIRLHNERSIYTISALCYTFEVCLNGVGCVAFGWKIYISKNIYPIIWKRWRFNVATNVVWLPVIDFGDDFDNCWFRWLVWRWLTGFLVQTEGDKHFSLSFTFLQFLSISCIQIITLDVRTRCVFTTLIPAAPVNDEWQAEWKVGV